METRHPFRRSVRHPFTLARNTGKPSPFVQNAERHATAGQESLGPDRAKLHVASNDFFLQLPDMLGGIAFLVVAWFVGRLIARGIRKAFHHKGLIDLGGVLASLAFGLFVAAAVLVASVIVFPSVKPVTIISSLGIGSVAIGFAFNDILQNLLAGILLLIYRPYRCGDQIVVEDFEGTVEHIQSRATLIKTYDGRRVIIPNSDVYTSPVVVDTAFPTRRSQFDVGIGYGDDPEKACRIFAAAVAKVEGWPAGKLPPAPRRAAAQDEPA